jgi:hypothetical protein
LKQRVFAPGLKRELTREAISLLVSNLY